MSASLLVVPFSPPWKQNSGCHMSGAEAVTMRLTLSHKAQLSVFEEWSNIP